MSEQLATYSPLQYDEEKSSGDRMPSGAKPLLSLSPRHIELVKAHLEGVPNQDLAQIFHMTPSTVSRILHDPLVVEIKEQHRRDVDAEFDALYQKSIAAIRAGLDEMQPAGIRLKAADMYLKQAAQRSESAAGAGGETAEDFARRILQLQLNVQVNTGDSNEHNGSKTASQTLIE
ncbi:MAG: hypothetical protein ACE5FD_03580 [Anaerolineae bacterium]